MKKNVLITLLAALLLSSCGEYNKLLKSTDYEYKYEAAKNYFAKGQYNRAATLLNELIAILKGTDKAEESLYMLGMSYYNQKDYQTAAQTFIQYYNVYPRGTFTELARFHAGKALYPGYSGAAFGPIRHVQCDSAIANVYRILPESSKKDEAQNMIFALQDKLVMKEYLSAKLYYNMGNYLGNNYQACVITAQNALKDYPIPICVKICPSLSCVPNTNWRYTVWKTKVQNVTAKLWMNVMPLKMSSPKVST